MKRSLLINKYKYSVQYNYVGGKVFADGELVGTIEHEDTPIEFESKKPSVTITIEGKPENTRTYETVTQEAAIIWGNAVDIYGRLYLSYYVNNTNSYAEVRWYYVNQITRVDRWATVQDLCDVTFTVFSVPNPREITPGNTATFSYTSKSSTSQEYVTVSETIKEYTLQADDPIAVSLRGDLTIQYYDNNQGLSNIETVNSNYNTTIERLDSQNSYRSRVYPNVQYGSFAVVRASATLFGLSFSVG